MTKEKKFYLFFSIAIITASIFLIGAQIFIYLKLSAKQASAAEKEYYIERADQKKQILETLESRYESLTPDLVLIDSALPDEKNSSKLIADLNTLAESTNLKLTSIRPTNDSSQSNTKKNKAAVNPELLQTVKGDIAYELPLEIKTQGSYNNFLLFLKRIENYQRLINIETVSIEKKDGGASDFVEVTIKLRAYLKK